MEPDDVSTLCSFILLISGILLLDNNCVSHEFLVNDEPVFHELLLYGEKNVNKQVGVHELEGCV